MENRKVKIQIGLAQYETGWEVLLEQIGISWNVIPDFNLVTVNEYSMVIINKHLSIDETSNLQKFLRDGGASLNTSSGDIGTSQTRRVSSFPPTVTESYRFCDILDIFNNCHFFPNNDIVQWTEVGKGISANLGIDIQTQLLSKKVIRKNFYTESKRLPNERVVQRSKAPLRQLVTSLLEFLHHKRNLPFIHKWYFPENHETIFTFRIDSDKGTQEQIENLYALGEKHNIPTTWFLDVKSHLNWLEYFSKFERQEIGVHCFEHVVYPSKILNKENFDKARAVLNKYQINAKGISAPTGAWNNQIGEAIEELGFDYSSEFGYDYDNLPSFPLLHDSFLSVLQLPIHPICIGSLLRTHSSNTEMISYFISVIENKIIANEPVCLYHHPTHMHNDVFEEVFNYINQAGIQKFSYSQYAKWWKKRSTCHFDILVDETKVYCKNGESADDVWLRISLPDGNEAIMSTDNDIFLDELANTAKRKFPECSKDIMRTRSFDGRHYIQNAFDWWIKVTE
ncbi:MAG: hypothetical protein PHP42_03545 [Bacteroidota bacterium]|nr:hypothetical protein [Bacteroidota bacterium]